MAYRPAQVYTGSGWDDVGDKRMLTHNHSGGANGTNIAQSSVTGLTTALAAKVTGTAGSTAPGSPVTGQVFIDTDDNSLKIWDGSAWVDPSNAGGYLTAADVSGTTGSPTITTYTDSGVGYTVYKFTASGSITLSKAGACDVLVVGGGGNGGGGTGIGGGGGGGGGAVGQSLWLSGASHTITIGAGGGNYSALGGTLRTGGGNAPNANGAGSSGACGSGASAKYLQTAYGGGASLHGQGYGGGSAHTGPGTTGGGGGGAGGAGGNAGSFSPGAAGAGLASSITGSSVTYSAGGPGKTDGTGAGSNGTANTGNGAQGGGGTSGGTGGSGVVIIRVRT